MNQEFLTAIFGENAPWSHVTSFAYPPDDIPTDRHMQAWKGDYACRAQIEPDTNQYFTISLFYADENGHARRRKALFRQTNCIVLDDVKEKLSVEACQRLPAPSWVLETSEGSEQWGYILATPCTDRARVENLLDGLVAQGLAPDGKDPGMKGVTRYVRLPDGINNKRSKGLFKCRLTTWSPFQRVTLEQLAAPFCVDLDAQRRDTRVDGAADVADHPLLSVEQIQVKEVRSDGRFDITCPWVGEHTDHIDNGAAIFTNADGSFGFKCHHGACQSRTGADLLAYIRTFRPSFDTELRTWQLCRDVAGVAPPPASAPAVPPPPMVSFLPDTPAQVAKADPLDSMLDRLRRERPTSQEARDTAALILKHVDSMPKIDQKVWHDQVRDLMDWNAQAFKDILTDLRKQWYGERAKTADFYDALVYVRDINQFYDRHTRIFYTAEAMQNSYCDQDAEARKSALQEGLVKKVDHLDYAPKQPQIFQHKGKTYGNTWSDESQEAGAPGDCSWWLDHWDVLDWGENKEHMLNWMAYTLQHPEHKINHALILSGGEGCGKDFLLYPLIKAMGDNAEVISGEELLEGFNEYLLSTKYLHINEIELGDYKDAKKIAAKLKPMASAPPETIPINRKGISRVSVRNIVNCTMTSNSIIPIRLDGSSRRYYAVWSDFNPRDARGDMLPAWRDYWCQRWDWMHGDGWKACVDHLMKRDLRGFNPFAQPPKTEHTREIQEQSKSPMLQTIETFIRKKHGIFCCDLLSAQDMEDILRHGALFSSDMQLDGKFFTRQRIGRELRESGIYRQVKTRDVRLWVVRNPEKYAGMAPATVLEAYTVQIQKARRDAGLKAVS